MSTYQDMYLDVNTEFSKVIKQSLTESNGEKHAQIASYFDDYSKWMDLVKNENEEIIYREAKSEYKTMLLFLCMGLYKNAYMSLRGYFELTTFGVKISTCDLDFRLWKNDKKDVHWSEITNPENGIFSEKFVEMYNRTFADAREAMREDALEMYRVCSEYIHSGYKVTSKEIEVDFDQDIYSTICKDVSRINRIITYVFCNRYGDLIKKTGKITDLEECILEQLPDIKAVHEYIREEK